MQDHKSLIFSVGKVLMFEKSEQKVKHVIGKKEVGRSAYTRWIEFKDEIKVDMGWAQVPLKQTVREGTVPVEMTVSVNDNKTMRAAQRELRLSHTRENVSVCGTCAVRCMDYTTRRLQANLSIACKRKDWKIHNFALNIRPK